MPEQLLSSIRESHKWSFWSIFGLGSCHQPECWHQAGVPARGTRCVPGQSFSCRNEGAGSAVPLWKGSWSLLPPLGS